MTPDPLFSSRSLPMATLNDATIWARSTGSSATSAAASCTVSLVRPTSLPSAASRLEKSRITFGTLIITLLLPADLDACRGAASMHWNGGQRQLYCVEADVRMETPRLLD